MFPGLMLNRIAGADEDLGYGQNEYYHDDSAHCDLAFFVEVHETLSMVEMRTTGLTRISKGLRNYPTDFGLICQFVWQFPPFSCILSLYENNIF